MAFVPARPGQSAGGPPISPAEARAAGLQCVLGVASHNEATMDASLTVADDVVLGGASIANHPLPAAEAVAFVATLFHQGPAFAQALLAAAAPAEPVAASTSLATPATISLAAAPSATEAPSSLAPTLEPQAQSYSEAASTSATAPLLTTSDLPGGVVQEAGGVAQQSESVQYIEESTNSHEGDTTTVLPLGPSTFSEPQRPGDSNPEPEPASESSEPLVQPEPKVEAAHPGLGPQSVEDSGTASIAGAECSAESAATVVTVTA
jgi:hypothetical protein